MWDGGNVAHYAREQPRVLIDGDPRRAPWIDLGDLRTKGAVVVWTGGDPAVMPVALRGIAGDAQVQPPFTLPFRRAITSSPSAGRSCAHCPHSRGLVTRDPGRTGEIVGTRRGVGTTRARFCPRVNPNGAPLPTLSLSQISRFIHRRRRELGALPPPLAGGMVTSEI